MTRKNIILIVIDSFNFNRIKDENARKQLTPFLHSLEKQGYFAHNMYSQAPYTEAAVMPLYCGQNVLDKGGYLERYNQCPKTIFELFKDNNYDVFFNSYQPQVFPTVVTRGINNLFYNVGFDLEALWGYRLEHYSELLSKDALTQVDWNYLIRCMDDNFDSWITFIKLHIQHDKTVSIIQTNSKTYDSLKVLEQVSDEYNAYNKNKKSYIEKLLIEGKKHILFTIPPYRQDNKVKDKGTREKAIELFKPLAQDIKKKNFYYNLKNNHLDYKGCLKKLRSCFPKLEKAQKKEFLKACYINVNAIYDLDIMDRVTEDYDTFKNAPSMVTHFEHFINWYDERKSNAPFFACMHPDDIHNPEVFFTYDTDNLELLHEEYESAKSYISKLPSNYKGSLTHDLSLRYADEKLATFFKELNKRNILDNTVITITADHGFSFSADPVRDSFVSNYYLENYRIPLWIVGKDIDICSDKKYHSSVDIPQTLSRLAGLESPANFVGEDIFSNGRACCHIEFCGGGCPDLSRRKIMFAVFDQEWFVAIKVKLDEEIKLEHIIEIYNLKNDPGQKKNLHKKKGAIEAVSSFIEYVDTRKKEIQKDYQIVVNNVYSEV